MFVSLLVPLDGSPFAEQALPLAAAIARRSGADLALVRNHILYAAREPAAQWGPFDPGREAECRREEQTYLDATARWVTAGSAVKVTTTLLSGLMPDSLFEHVVASGTDLVVMASHGRGPAGRFFLGGVADQMIRRVPVPVLVVRPHDPPPPLFPPPALEDVLIPLDGSPLAEQVLGPAVDLALALEARCTLLRVIESSPSPFPPPGKEAAEQYLERVAGRVLAQGLDVRTRVVVARRAAPAILAAARPGGAIALATHGRGGVRRLILGSVADRIIRGCSLPVLVYRPPVG